MSLSEIVLLQGAQSDVLSIYAVQGERIYQRVDQALGILRFFPLKPGHCKLAGAFAGQSLPRRILAFFTP